MKLRLFMLLLSCFLLLSGCMPMPEELETEGYYLVIGQENILDIEVDTPKGGGGCRRADNKPFKEGEKVWLEHLEGMTDLRGVTVRALDTSGEMVYALSIPKDAADDEITSLLEKDGWLAVP